MARPWSLPLSLFSIQRTHSVSPTAQVVFTVPPLFATKPATLPSTAAAAAVATGDVQLKPPPGAVQGVTAAKVLPKPYSSTMVCAAALPPLRHCSPAKRRVKLSRTRPLVLLRPNAM